MKTLTRRGLIGLAGAGALSAGVFGRYALSDGFEEHLAGVLGMPLDDARALASEARRRLGETDYDAVAAAFVASTTFPGEWVLPESLRRRSIHALLSEAVPDSHGNLLLLGLVPGGVSRSPCAGLVAR